MSASSSLHIQSSLLMLLSVAAAVSPTVFLVGDSHTEVGQPDSWVTKLQSRYNDTDFFIRAFPGYNTKWFLKYIAPIIQNDISSACATPSLITIWFGTNDAALTDGPASKNHVPVEDFKENLIQIGRMFGTAAPTATLLLITPPPINDIVKAQVAAQQKSSIDRSNAMASQYARACVEAGAVLNAPVLDLNAHFNEMPEATRNTFLSADGIHLNARGNNQVYELLQSKLQTELPNVEKILDAQHFPPASECFKHSFHLFSWCTFLFAVVSLL